MNNDNNQNSGKIDDILDILQKRKMQDLMNGNVKDDAPTRVDNTVVKNTQSSSFSFSSSGFDAIPKNQDQEFASSDKPFVQDNTTSGNTSSDNHHKSDSEKSDKPQESITTESIFENDENYAPKSTPTPSVQKKPAAASLPPIKATSNVPSQPSGRLKSVPGTDAARNDLTKQVPVNTSANSTNFPSGKGKSASSGPAANQKRNASGAGTPAKSNSQPKQAVSPQKNPNTSGVSLSDFDDKELEKATRKAVKKKNKKNKGVPGWVKVIIYLVIVISISVLISITVIKVSNDVFAFVKSDKEITVEIKENSTLSDVAQVLDKAGIIEYPWVFEKYADYKIDKRSYLTKNFTPGVHFLNPSMNYDQIISALCVSSYDKSVVRITIPEGYTFNQILDLLVENEVMKEEDREEYLTQLQEFPYEYEFITKLTEEGSLENSDRFHRLEGYLFPDTYDFYKNENPVAVMDKLFLNFENKFSEEMYSRANKLNMTVDEIITLASIIEAEGDTPANFAKISSVFHNRLKNKSGSFLYLGSDATTLYAYRIADYDKKTLGPGETDFQHPYNTYTNAGLPPGPICNPGIEAIYAALYPDDTNYYYFLTMANGETVFARTATEHNANIARSNKIAAEMKNAE